MSMEYFEQIRARAKDLAKRAADDPTLKEQLQRNPSATLATAGIPEELAGEFLQATGTEVDVTGYLGPMKVACVLSVLL